MRVLKIAALLIISILMVQNSLFSTIYCRVEGFVRDKDTGKGIPNVDVSLGFIFFDMPIDETVKTDKNGFFVFNKVTSRKNYIVICEKDGYVSNIPPYIKDAIMEKISDSYWRETFGIFNLFEGEIKHLDITLERGGDIKGKLLLKDTDGITPMKYIYIELRKEHEDDDIIPSYFMNSFKINKTHSGGVGEFSFKGLKPGNNYSIILQPTEKFATQFIKPVEVKINETSEIEFTFDLENKTGIKGIVNKGGIPLTNKDIYLVRLPDRFPYGLCYSDKDGNYSFLMLPPGFYEVSCAYFTPDDIMTEKKMNVTVEAEKIIIINFEF